MQHDEDTPGGGRHYCIACSKHFISDKALQTHQKGKPHKRRTAELLKLQAAGMAPHSAADAERAGGLGAPDKGPRLRVQPAAIPVATE